MSVVSLTRRIKQILLLVCVVLCLAGVASAYTVVMRSGRRVEIVRDFTVTATTLTYEVTPGIQITLMMTAIDAAATDRANNEPAGSLMRRVAPGAQAGSPGSGEAERPRGAAPPATRGARDSVTGRSITNRDLEAFEQARREGEITYERRRRELRLPSREESRRKAAEEIESMNARFDQRRSEERESESYWRSRASALRAELAAVNAQINYINVRLGEIPLSASTASFTVVTSVLPFSSFPRRFGGPRFRPAIVPRPNVFVAPGGGNQMRGGVRFGGGHSRGHVLINPMTFPHAPRPPLVAPPMLALPNLTVFSSPFQGYDFSYERTALVSQLNELLAIRAGLNARWRALEDEARQAGAPPGWLRP